MATTNTLAIVTAVRQRLTQKPSVLSGVRAISMGELLSGVYPLQADEARAREALVIPRLDVRVMRTGRSPAGALSETGNRQILRVDVELTTSYQLPPLVRADTTRAALDAVRARASDDAEQIRQAVGWPGGLAATAAGALTMLVSGCLRQTDPAEVTREDATPAAGLLELTHRYYGEIDLTLDFASP